MNKPTDIELWAWKGAGALVELFNAEPSFGNICPRSGIAYALMQAKAEQREDDADFIETAAYEIERIGTFDISDAFDVAAALRKK